MGGAGAPKGGREGKPCDGDVLAYNLGFGSSPELIKYVIWRINAGSAKVVQAAGDTDSDTAVAGDRRS